MNPVILQQFVVEDRRISDGVLVEVERTGPSDKALMAYIVTSEPVDLETLKSRLRSQLPRELVPNEIIQVTNIPLDKKGNVDYNLLSQVEVVNKELIARWERRLKDLPTINQVAVMLRPYEKALRPFHLSELFPNRLKPKDVGSPDASQIYADEVVGVKHSPSEMGLVEQERAWAISDGGELVMPADAPRTMVTALIRTVQQLPHKGMLYIQDDGTEIFQSYPELFDTAKCILSGLYAKGLKPKDRVVFQIASIRDHFPTFWACVLGGIIPVTVAIAPSYESQNSKKALHAVVNKLFNTWNLLDSPPIITSDVLVDAIKGLGDFLPMAGLKVQTVDELKAFPPTEDFYQSKPEDVLFHQLTSGSTGVPKCIQITHKGVVAHIHGSQQFNGYRSEDVTLNWLPLDHVVPILTCHLKDVYLGCQQVEINPAQILSEPLKWLYYMDKYKVTHSWAPNFGFKLVNDRLKAGSDQKWDLSRVKYLMNAGEQVTPPVVRDFRQLLAPFGLHKHAMQPAFGMAEACTCMTYRNGFDVANENHIQTVLKSSLSGHLVKSEQDNRATISFVDLGPPVPGIQIRITDQENNLLPEGVIGRFQIKGDVITPGYLNNEVANREAFVGDGWFNSGDLGFITGGSLTLTGREKEMIVIRGANYYCYEIEDVVNRIDGVESTFVGAIGVHDSDTGTEGLVICFVPSNRPRLDLRLVIQTIKQKVASEIGIGPLYVIALQKDSFPKTTSGKIQRGRLKKSFLEGQYRERIMEVDILMGQNTLPQWFFKRTWRRDNGQPFSAPSIESVLIFADETGLGERVAEILKPQNIRCILVETGEKFEQSKPKRYKLNPANPLEYKLLVKAIARDGGQISHVLHFWTYDNHVGTNVTFLSHRSATQQMEVLSLVQALAEARSSANGVSLLCVSNRSQAVFDHDCFTSQKAPLIGMIGTISQELPWLRVRHVDLETQAQETGAEHVVREMGLMHNRQEVAYRNGQRWTAGLEAVDLTQSPATEMPIKENGSYVVTGGLGGIGIELCKYLLEQYNARLLILGRSAKSTKREAIEELEKLNGKVNYKSVDICSLASVQQVIDQFVADGTPLAGVFHLAGAYHDKYLTEESVESFAQILAPKVTGSRVLAQALQKHNPAGLFVTFASIFSYFGTAQVGAYAASNRFLEAFTIELRQNTSLKSFCYAWSNWADVGMSQGYQSLLRYGYQAISIKQGLLSLTAALKREIPFMLIGLDGSKGNISAHCNTVPSPSHKLLAYLSPSQNGALIEAELEKLVVRDQFGNRSRPLFVQRKALPLSADGEVDKKKLQQDGFSTGKKHVPATNRTEHLLVSIWKELLAIDKVGVRDNFFEMGGSSLLMAQLQNQIRQQFDRELTTVEIFKYPTIRAMSEYLNQVEQKQSFRDKSASRAKARKQLRRRRKRSGR